jgi:hypothetical protein
VIFLPADFREQLHAPDEITVEKLKKLNYTLEEAEKVNHNFRSIHELGHLVAEKMLVSFYPGKPNKWYNEFIASYLAYAFFAEKYPKEAEIVKVMSDYQEHRQYSPKYSKLDDFETLYSRVGGENYGWFQNRFLKLAFDIYEKDKVGFIKKLKTADFNKNQKMPVEELIKKLETITPGFVKWSEPLQ